MEKTPSALSGSRVRSKQPEVGNVRQEMTLLDSAYKFIMEVPYAHI